MANKTQPTKSKEYIYEFPCEYTKGNFYTSPRYKCEQAYIFLISDNIVDIELKAKEMVLPYIKEGLSREGLLKRCPLDLSKERIKTNYPDRFMKDYFQLRGFSRKEVLKNIDAKKIPFKTLPENSFFTNCLFVEEGYLQKVDAGVFVSTDQMISLIEENNLPDIFINFPNVLNAESSRQRLSLIKNEQNSINCISQESWVVWDIFNAQKKKFHHTQNEDMYTFVKKTLSKVNWGNSLPYRSNSFFDPRLISFYWSIGAQRFGAGINPFFWRGTKIFPLQKDSFIGTLEELIPKVESFSERALLGLEKKHRKQTIEMSKKYKTHLKNLKEIIKGTN